MTQDHFNATEELSRGIRRIGLKEHLKVSHFLDNTLVKSEMKKNQWEATITHGRDGHTRLPAELRELFDAWMLMQTRVK